VIISPGRPGRILSCLIDMPVFSVHAGNMAASPRSAQLELGEKAYLFVREQILRGELRLGAVLSRRKLAARLGVSVFPISEALLRLENEGLVESKPQVGTRVRVPSEKDIRERFIVREALESQSARLVAERATLEQRRELNRMAENVDALFSRQAAGNADSGFVFAVHSYHLQLHMRIAEYSGCAALSELIEKNNVLVLNWIFDRESAPVLPPTFHRDLLRIVTGNRADAADGAMRHHVRSGLEEAIRAVARFHSAGDGRWRIRATANKLPNARKFASHRPLVSSNR
jgi:DNA-binding GntR family transcriptional regulator